MPGDPDASGYRYRDAVRRALGGFGLQPRPSTRPSLLREFVGALYRHELRRLRAALLAGAFPRAEYAPRVAALRARYALLSLPPDAWTEDPLPPDELERLEAQPPC